MSHGGMAALKFEASYTQFYTYMYTYRGLKLAILTNRVRNSETICLK